MPQAFAQRALALFKEVVDCKIDGLPMYNDLAIRAVLKEIETHSACMAEISSKVRNAASTNQQSEEDTRGAHASSIYIHVQCILRNKRLLLAYHKKRLELIKRIFWEHQTLPSAVESKLSEVEKQTFINYKKLVKEYMSGGEHGIDIDLTTDLLPPKDPNLAVRVLQDNGETMLSIGAVFLRRGSVLLLPRADAELLIRQGVVTDAELEGLLSSEL